MTQIQHIVNFSIRHRIREQLHPTAREHQFFAIAGPYSTPPKTTLQSKTNKTTPTTMLQQKSAIFEHDMHPEDQTIVHSHSKGHKKHQEQPPHHLNRSSKAKQSYTTKHPNYHETANTTHTKDIYSLYTPSMHKKNTIITYTTSISETIQQLEPL